MRELDDSLETLYVAHRDGVGELVASARRSVAVWRWATPFVLEHRREPLLHERLWLPRGRWLDTVADLDGTHERYGYDAEGELAIALGPGSTVPDGVPLGQELPGPRGYGWFPAGSVVMRAPSLIVCFEFSELRDGDEDRWTFRLDGLIRYRSHDERVAETEYFFGWGKDPRHSESGRELYSYTGDRGSLCAIEEYANLSDTTPEFGTRGDVIEIGGRLDARPAADGAHVAIYSGKTVVWCPAPAPWHELLDQYSARAAHACREAIVEWASADRARAQRPVISIFLDDYTQATPGAALSVAFASPTFAGGDAIWPHLLEVANWIDFDDDHGTLLRVGACAGRDVQAETSVAVARRLREFDWSGILTLSDDLLVYADHSENPDGAMLANARRANPSDVVERWIARGWLSD